MKIGTENKKTVYALAVLGLVGGHLRLHQLLLRFLLAHVGAEIGRPHGARAGRRRGNGTPAAPVPAPLPTAQPEAPRQLGTGGRSRGDEFHPSLRSKRKEDQIDPLTVDPDTAAGSAGQGAERQARWRPAQSVSVRQGRSGGRTQGTGAEDRAQGTGAHGSPGSASAAPSAGSAGDPAASADHDEVLRIWPRSASMARRPHSSWMAKISSSPPRA